MPNVAGPKASHSSSTQGPLKMKTGPFNAMSGSTGPNRNTTSWRKVKQHTQDKGL